jgi:hypothetical protein
MELKKSIKITLYYYQKLMIVIISKYLGFLMVMVHMEINLAKKYANILINILMIKIYMKINFL